MLFNLDECAVMAVMQAATFDNIPERVKLDGRVLESHTGERGFGIIQSNLKVDKQCNKVANELSY